ncbi:hypothetical protein A3K73_06115 [Candidatus Pacearchaeota archaeon RBG_13_36_9]|nr:MAG: hypothetical protein A3K73_06115 [Candidatus Pacearchaeota archaeon RBG_13_36_9]
MEEKNDEGIDEAFREFAEELMSSQAKPEKRTAYFSKKKNLQKFVNSFRIGELIFYAEVFGTEKLFRLQVGNIDYIIFDSYCVVPDCDCTETRLSFTKKTEESTTDENFSFLFDYINNDPKDGKNISESEMEEITKEFTNDMKNIMKQRHEELKEKLKPFMIGKIEKLYGKNLLIEPKRKIGRNSPCPCGSGKKYKKCCIDKDIGI